MAAKPTHRLLWGAIHIFALFAIAIAHPVLDLLVKEDHVTLLVAHQSRTEDVFLLVAVLCLALPLALCLVIWTFYAISSALGRTMHSLIVWLLAFAFIQILCNQHLNGYGWLPTAASAVAAFALVLLYRRSAPARYFVTLLGPAIVVVPALFLLNPAIQPLIANADDSMGEPLKGSRGLPHILLLVFDELPLASLLDEHGGIDGGRYPNFADLAATSTWYRNANTIHYATRFSIPSILTGTDHWERFGKQNVNRPRVMLQRETFPENIFLLFEDTHDSYVLMSNSEFTMPVLQDLQYMPPLAERFSFLASDLVVIFGHQVFPEPLRGLLPGIEGQWQDFAGDRQFGDDPEEWPYQGGKPYRIRQLIEALHRSNRPGLYVTHVVLPHHPYRHNESGQLHENVIHIPDDRVKIPKGRNIWDNETAANAAWQAHLLQLGFVDRLLGMVLQRLRDLRMFDDTLIVVTADHGISFYWDDQSLPPSDFTAIQSSEVLNVPLFIKAPDQTQPRVSDEIVQTIDILPTVAGMLNVDIPWETDGISVLTETNDPDQRYSWLMSQRASLAQLEFPDLVPAHRKAVVFGTGDYERLYNYGPRPELWGQPVSEPTTRIPSKEIAIHDLDKFMDVDPQSGEVPAYVQAEWRISGGNDVGPETVFAVAVNGVIRGTSRAEIDGGVAHILFRVPPQALRKGANDIQIIEVRRSISVADGQG